MGAVLVRDAGKAIFAFLVFAASLVADLTADFLAGGVGAATGFAPCPALVWDRAGLGAAAFGKDFAAALPTVFPAAFTPNAEAVFLIGAGRCATAGFARLAAGWGEALGGVLVAMGKGCGVGWVHQGGR